MMLNDLPWLKMHDVLLKCGNIKNPTEFPKRVLNDMYVLIPYDQARLYFINDNGRIFDEYLIGVDARWSKDYREYYSTIGNGRYAINTPEKARLKTNVHDWTNELNDEFLLDHLHPQGIKHSLGFGLFDAEQTLKCVLILDRISNIRYSLEDIEIIGYIFPHLNNLHENFFVNIEDSIIKSTILADKSLTSREIEVAKLLCRGVSTANISEKLCISKATVKKHIANMHNKLNVTTRQELVVRLMHTA